MFSGHCVFLFYTKIGGAFQYLRISHGYLSIINVFKKYTYI
jgi:hypothetical protein